MTIHDEVDAERERAHRKHGPTSMRSEWWLSHRRASILTEEVGEVASALNEYDHGNLSRYTLRVKLRSELVQVAAMAVDWIEAIDMADADG